MFNFLKRKYAEVFDKAADKLKVALYADLVNKFGKSEESKTISAQAVNYLTGADFLNQSNISPAIIKVATMRGLRKLDNDSEVRELIVELNKGILDYKQWTNGKKYSLDYELDNVKQILSIYIEQYPGRFKLVKFEKLVETYCRKIIKS